jgi:putative MATE family efflux protein
MNFLKEDLNITEGVIWKQVMVFFIPVVIGAFFQHFYTIVDTVVVGRGLGTLELSAVGGSASRLIVTITNFFIGVSVGITAFASQYAGKKDYKMLKAITFNGLFAFTIIGLIVSVLGFVFASEFLLLLKTPVETLEMSRIYLRTYLVGMVFCVVYNALAGILRAMGDAKRPLYVLIFTSLVNISLDVLLALVLGMGVFGVAMATVVAQTISAFILASMLLKTLRGTEAYSMKIETRVIKDILALGIPAGLQSMMYSFSNILVQMGVNSFGAVSVAGWTAYVRINSILNILVGSFGSTAITFVGQNYGANNMDRVGQCVKQIIRISYTVTALVALVFILNRHSLLAMFSRDPEVVSVGISIMFAIIPMYLFAVPQEIFSQALRGLGVSFVPMLLTILGVVGSRVFWVYAVLPIKRELWVLGLCYPASSLIMLVVFWIYYRYEMGKVKYGQVESLDVEA